MSEPRLISPLLDGCIIGEAISCHNGVRCCPAIRQATSEKYIVKIISVPASQVQLDALLLTGAFESKEAAAAYFEELTRDVLEEKNILSAMSRMEGFTGYEAAQVVPMEEGTGYEVYLISPYKRSMERVMSTETLTHLRVVNMGLDLCAALAACRRAGFLYVDLKPENIFHIQDNDYRIGDLGFVAMSALSYTALPEKYYSRYTPAEVLDPMAVLNGTVDTYALGLVLYQAYNGGKLPPRDAGGAPLPAPEYADYEMAEIILKACAPDPADRWEDPMKMGQALVNYMQRNTVNDEPIIPPVLEPEEPEAQEEAPEEFLPEKELEPEELAFLHGLSSDETAPNEENTEHIADTAVTEETSEMLAQADDLIAHELPEPVVAPEAEEVPVPEPIEVPMPEISLEAPEEAPPQEETAREAAPEDAQEDAAQEDTAEAGAETAEVPAQEPQPEPVQEELPRRLPSINFKPLIAVVAVLAVIACIAIGSLYYYDNIYLQNIDRLIVEGSEDAVTVRIDSDISEEKLSVYCTDSYGNTRYSTVTAGVAIFRNLDANTRYSIRVEIDGMHKLTGVTTSSYTTAPQIAVEDFQAVIGATDGSALLTFRPDANTDGQWLLTYSAPGVEEQTISFTGHVVSVNDLVIGSEYTFTLSSPDGLTLIGDTQTTLKAGKLMFAKDLMVTSCVGSTLGLAWNAPEGETVGTWTIRCYNETGYNKTITTSKLSCTFTDLDLSSTCTVEVFAENMSQSVFITVGANPITVTGFRFDTTTPGLLKLVWDFNGTNPGNGWVVNYSVDGLAQETVYTMKNYAELYVIPGSHYKVAVTTADGSVVFGGTTTYDLPEAERFAGYGLTADDINSTLCLRPEAQYWSYTSVPPEDYINTYAAGQRAGMILHALKKFQTSQDNVRITYLVRSQDGTLLHVDTANSLWSNIFPGTFGALNIPFLPEDPGSYTITIYFNGEFVTVRDFTII